VKRSDVLVVFGRAAQPWALRSEKLAAKVYTQFEVEGLREAVKFEARAQRIVCAGAGAAGKLEQGA
jgi:hypothetical protein